MSTREEASRLIHRIAELETDLRHHQNELHVTRIESDEASKRYFDLYVHLEQKVQARTLELEEANRRLRVEIEERRRTEQEKEGLIPELQEALTRVKTLSGLLPICAACKKIRDDRGYWNQIEEYLHEHSEARFSHGICPDCARKLYPDIQLNL